MLVRELSDSNNNHKKTEDPLKGIRLLINRLGCHQVDTYTYTKILSTTFRLCNPLLLDAHKSTLDLSIPFPQYGHQYKTENTQSYTIHLQQK